MSRDPHEIYLDKLLDMSAKNSEMYRDHTHKIEKLNSIYDSLSKDFSEFKMIMFKSNDTISEIEKLMKHTTNSELSKELQTLRDLHGNMNSMAQQILSIATDLKDFNKTEAGDNTSFNDKINNISNSLEYVKSKVSETDKREKQFKQIVGAIMIALTLISGVVVYINNIMQAKAITKAVEEIKKNK